MVGMSIVETPAASLADLRNTLARRVAIRTESQNPDSSAELLRYLDEEIEPQLARLGFTRTRWANPLEGKPLAHDDAKMRALEAYILAQRAGKPLEAGKH